MEDIEKDIKNKGFQGLKVYRMYSVTGDMANCTIDEYLPHEQLELANELGLWVTLHLSREDGCGDEKNLKDLTSYYKKIPLLNGFLLLLLDLLRIGLSNKE